jgi:hypothetical protein
MMPLRVSPAGDVRHRGDMADLTGSSDTGRMIAFLREIGIPVDVVTLRADGFLPGLLVDHGRLVVDLARLRYPGDLLHEGGHIALVEPSLRPLLTTDVGLPGLDMTRLEHAVVPWSYAAARHLGIDPAVVFHDGGYRGKARGLLATFAFGVYPGVPMLEELGLTAAPARAAELGVAPYPHMLRWLREAPGEAGSPLHGDRDPR